MKDKVIKRLLEKADKKKLVNVSVHKAAEDPDNNFYWVDEDKLLDFIAFIYKEANRDASYWGRLSRMKNERNKK